LSSPSNVASLLPLTAELSSLHELSEWRVEPGMPTSPSPSTSPSQVHTFTSRSVVACFEIGCRAMEHGYRGCQSLDASAGRTATQGSGRRLPEVRRCLTSTSWSTILKMKTRRRRLSKHEERVLVWIAILCATNGPLEVSATELRLRLPPCEPR
jgi:hypothetical protein